MSPGTGFVTEAPNKEFHADRFSALGFRALSLIFVESFSEIFTLFDVPSCMIFVAVDDDL